MRKEENCIILEDGDTLYRYDLEENLPDNWDSNYHNFEYSGSRYGFKNAIGAIFLFDKKLTAKQILSGAINNQKEKTRIITRATITTVIVNEEIKLLDLSSGIIRCSNLLSVLYELNMDVTVLDLKNFQKDLPFQSIHDRLIDLYSSDSTKRMTSANEIDRFFYGRINLLGQTLTDFQNGILFKKLLEDQQFEGYVFWENPSSDTYCILSSSKLSNPIHEIIDVEMDEELQQLLQQDLAGRMKTS